MSRVATSQCRLALQKSSKIKMESDLRAEGDFLDASYISRGGVKEWVRDVKKVSPPRPVDALERKKNHFEGRER